MRFTVTIISTSRSYELDLSGGDVNSMVIGSWSQILHVGPDFLKRMDELDCDADSERKLKLDTNTPPAIKLQINAGGGSFPLHYDNVSMFNKTDYILCYLQMIMGPLISYLRYLY